jgi:hypothetical protein
MSEHATPVAAGLDDDKANDPVDTPTKAVPNCDLSGLTCYFAPPVGLGVNGWGGNSPVFRTPHCCHVTITDPENSTAGESCVEEESDSQNHGELWLAERRRAKMNQNGKAVAAGFDDGENPNATVPLVSPNGGQPTWTYNTAPTCKEACATWSTSYGGVTLTYVAEEPADDVGTILCGGL